MQSCTSMAGGRLAREQSRGHCYCYCDRIRFTVIIIYLSQICSCSNSGVLRVADRISIRANPKWTRPPFVRLQINNKIIVIITIIILISCSEIKLIIKFTARGKSSLIKNNFAPLKKVVTKRCFGGFEIRIYSKFHILSNCNNKDTYVKRVVFIINKKYL